MRSRIKGYSAVVLLLSAAVWLSACAGSPEDEPRTWRTASSIETGTADAGVVQAVLNAGGNGVAVWVEDNGSADYRVAARRYVDGHWSSVEYLQNDTRDSESAQVAMDAAGNITAVWLQFYEDGAYNVWGNRYSSKTGPWGTAQLLQSGTTGARAPSVMMDKGGNAIAVWSQDGGESNYSIWTNRYDAAAGRWGTPEKIQAGAGNGQDPHLGMDGAGNALAVWREEEDPGSYTVRASRYNVATGRWDASQAIQSAAGNALFPQLGVDSAGNAIAVWHQEMDAESHNVWWNRFTAETGQWGTARLLQSGSSDALSPRIAMGEDGSCIAAWYQDGGTDHPYNIWANRFSISDGNWTGARVITPTEQAGAYPKVGVDAAGNALAVWISYEERDETFLGSVWSNRYDVSSDAWGTPVLLKSGTTDADYATIAMGPDGRAFALWVQDNGSGDYNVRAARFE
jgi:hypothetical protein